MTKLPDTLRQRAIEAGARTFCREIAKCVPALAQGGDKAIDQFVDREWRTWLAASTAAFDAHLSVIIEPDEAMIEAGGVAADHADLADELPGQTLKYGQAWEPVALAAFGAMILKLSETGE